MKKLILMYAFVVFLLGCDQVAIDPRITSYIKDSNRVKALGREYLGSGTNATAKVWQSFNSVFPYHSEQTGLTFNRGNKSWELDFIKNGIWWDRYIITISAEISVASDLSTLKEKRLEVQVTELKRVSKHADGRFSFDYTGPVVELNQQQWAEVSTNPVALSKFGISILTNRPIPLASKYLEFEGASLTGR